MPEPSVGISSSIAVFLLLTSVCCILSLSSTDDSGLVDISSGASVEQRKVFGIAKYVPNLVITFVMLIGIAAMVILMFKQDDLTTRGNEGLLTRRHYLHRKHSLRSIIFFFVPESILHLNYLIVEISCVDRWTHCDKTVTNWSEIIFHSVCFIFASFEMIVCWIMKPRNFKPSQWVWHGVAIIQAANFAIWFDSLLKEAYHRIHDNAEFFDSYFSFCNTTSQNRSHSGMWCSDSSIAASWFVWSCPFLFPITIEFALLVSETFLGKVIIGNDNDNGENVPADRPGTGRSGADADERTPLLLHGNDNQNRATLPSEYRNSCYSQIFVVISLVMNIVYLVLTVLVFVGYKLNGHPDSPHHLQPFDNAFTIYTIVYDVFSMICCVVGIVSSRKFRRPHSHTSFLEYLLLVATAGVLLQSMKRLVAFASSGNGPMFAVYITCVVVDMCQSVFQIVFYYFAKDVKLQPSNNGGPADSASRVVVFNASLVVIAVSNLFIWISDSFLIPQILPGITPSDYAIDQWPVFDNAVTPITIFFRFNSAMLFWCIGTDVFQPGELHQD